MTYGITFETANGNVQIDSDTTNTGLIVLSSAASSASVTFDPQKELVFCETCEYYLYQSKSSYKVSYEL